MYMHQHCDGLVTPKRA